MNGDDPAPEPSADMGASAPRGGSWALVLGGRDWSGVRRSSAFSLARGALDGLEAQLALEEAALAREYDELERAWTSFFEVVEQRRHDNEAMQAQREEVLRFAKEVRESAVREAQETLEPLQAERQAAADDREAAVAERQAAASERATLARR